MASTVRSNGAPRVRGNPVSTSADEVIAVDVVERLLANPSTRYAWLLGFLTGSALADGPLGPPAPAVKAAEGA